MTTGKVGDVHPTEIASGKKTFFRDDEDSGGMTKVEVLGEAHAGGTFAVTIQYRTGEFPQVAWEAHMVRNRRGGGSRERCWGLLSMLRMVVLEK